MNAIEKAILQDLNWIFREQLVVDMGIDAHMEQCIDGDPTGKLVALQIKTGASHFTIKEEELIYYGNPVHLSYWNKHSLPVLLLAHIPETGTTYWVEINIDKVSETKKGWKISIPKSNILSSSDKEKIEPLFDGRADQQRFRKLVIDEPLMRHIKSGNKVSIELEDWVNKSLGRTPVEIYVYDEDGEETLVMEWYQTYTGYTIKALAEATFPWCWVCIDEEFYDENGDFGECFESGFTEYGEEDDVACQRAKGDLYPYTEGGGEVEAYRLQLNLNNLGESYLAVSEYIYSKDD